MNKLTIRRAASSDIERIVQLRLLGQKHFEKSNPLIWRLNEEGKKLLKAKVEDELTDGNVRILLAEADGEVIGYIQGEITRRNDYTPRTVGHVSLVHVVRKFRRRGVGTRLMIKLLEFFGSNKAENLTVRYIIGNKEAEEFWKKLGFKSIITTGSTSSKELDIRLKRIANSTNMLI